MSPSSKVSGTMIFYRGEGGKGVSVLGYNYMPPARSGNGYGHGLDRCPENKTLSSTAQIKTPLARGARRGCWDQK